MSGEGVGGRQAQRRALQEVQELLGRGRVVVAAQLRLREKRLQAEVVLGGGAPCWPHQAVQAQAGVGGGRGAAGGQVQDLVDRAPLERGQRGQAGEEGGQDGGEAGQGEGLGAAEAAVELLLLALLLALPLLRQTLLQSPLLALAPPPLHLLVHLRQLLPDPRHAVLRDLDA